MSWVAAAIGGSAIVGLYGASQNAKAINNAANLQAQAAAQAQALQQAEFNTINTQEAPQRAAGYTALNQLNALGSGNYQKYDVNGNPIGTGTGSGYLTKQFGDQDLNANIAPNYAFQLQQGQGAINSINNVNGGGGNAAQGLQQFTQNYAQGAYQNAFNNFQAQRTNIYNTLAGIAGLGQNAQTATNAAGTANVNAQSQLGIGAASALGQGQIGAAQAQTGALNALGQGATLWALLNQRSPVQAPQGYNPNTVVGPGTESGGVPFTTAT